LDVLHCCYENAWFQASAMKQLRTAFFLGIMLRVVIISYRNLLRNNPVEWSSHLLWEHQISQCVCLILITLPKFDNTLQSCIA
jgi:type VI protein secretion system component VasK